MNQTNLELVEFHENDTEQVRQLKFWLLAQNKARQPPPPQPGDACPDCLLPIAFYPGPEDFTPHCFVHARRGEADQYIYRGHCQAILIERLRKENAELRARLGLEG